MKYGTVQKLRIIFLDAIFLIRWKNDCRAAFICTDRCSPDFLYRIYISECKMEVKLSEEAFGRKITVNQEKITIFLSHIKLCFLFFYPHFIYLRGLFQLAARIIVTTRAVCHDDPYGWR